MQIKCQECGFSRQVNDSQIPAGSCFATCPKCNTRFRFRPDQAKATIEEHSPPKAGKTKNNTEDEPKEGDIWASMDKMRREWDEADSEEKNEEVVHNPKDQNPLDEAIRREEASRAYRQAAAQVGSIPFLSSVGSVPWEYKGGFLNPLAFVRTVILILTRTPTFFAGINPLSSVIPAWLFYILSISVPVSVGVMGINFITTSPDGSQQVVPMYEMVNPYVLIFAYVCFFTFLLFIGSFIINYAIQLHSGPRASFRLTFKTMAYSNTPIMLTVLPGALGMLGLFASIMLLFLGIRYAYGFSWRKTIISVTPYLLLSIFFVLMILQAAVGGAGPAA